MKGSFEWMDSAIKTDCGGSLNKLALVALASFCNADGECWPSHETLRRRAEMSDHALRRAMRSLADAGFVTTESRPRQANRYRLNLTPANMQGRGGRCAGEGVADMQGRINNIDQNKEQTKKTNQVNPPLPPSAEVGNGSGVGNIQSAVESEVRVSDVDWDSVQAEALNIGYSRGYDTEDFVEKVDEAVAEIAGWRDIEYIDRLLRQGKTIGDIEAYLTKTLYHIAENKIKCARALAS